MLQVRFTLRFGKKENDGLVKIAKSNGMSVTDYIKYRIFHNNPDISGEDFIYETPAKDKNNYINAGVLHEIYWMMNHLISKDKNEQELYNIKTQCREKAKNNITNYGYLKVAKDE